MSSRKNPKIDNLSILISLASILIGTSMLVALTMYDEYGTSPVDYKLQRLFSR